MSVVAAVEVRDGVAVATDTQVTAGEEIWYGAQKAFMPRPWLLVASTGSPVVFQKIRYRMKWPTTPPEDPYAWLVGEFVYDYWHALKVADLRYEQHNSDMLLAWGGLVWWVDWSGGVYRDERGYVAMGSGAAWAQGALAAYGPSQDGTRARALASVRAAVKVSMVHCASVGGDVHEFWVPS